MHTAIIVGLVVLSLIVVVNTLLATKYFRQWKKYEQARMKQAPVVLDVLK